MARRLIHIPAFDNFGEYCEYYKLFGHRQYANWRLVEPRVPGGIVGLPNIHGVLTATDGVRCHLILDDGQIFIGHIASFEPDSDTAVIEVRKDGTVKKKDSPSKKQLERIKVEYE